MLRVHLHKTIIESDLNNLQRDGKSNPLLAFLEMYKYKPKKLLIHMAQLVLKENSSKFSVSSSSIWGLLSGREEALFRMPRQFHRVLKNRCNLFYLIFKNYSLCFSNIRTKGWALIICKTRPPLKPPKETTFSTSVMSRLEHQVEHPFSCFLLFLKAELQVLLPEDRARSLLSQAWVLLPRWGNEAYWKTAWAPLFALQCLLHLTLVEVEVFWFSHLI